MAGRPSKYKPEMCDKVIELMKEGASIEEVALELDISKSNMYAWMDKHAEFQNAIKEGEFTSKGWWMNQGRRNIKNKEFNSTLWYMNMKNRFGWKDKHEHSADDKTVKQIVGMVIE